jgi:hypothetical protein
MDKEKNLQKWFEMEKINVLDWNLWKSGTG